MARSLFGRRAPEPSPDKEPEYWLSYSDLMAGLLMVFALMLMAALYQQGTRECQLMSLGSGRGHDQRSCWVRESVSIDSLRVRFGQRFRGPKQARGGRLRRDGPVCWKLAF